MSPLKQMYEILEQMLKSVESRNKEQIAELNSRYDLLLPEVYQNPLTKLDLEYDNCRQSCVMSVKWEYLVEEFASDARQRFLKIPKPKR